MENSLVPAAKLLSNLKAAAGAPVSARRVVLVSTGAYCPIHAMHTEVFERIKTYLESNGEFIVVGGFLSPSHDAYVKGKLNSAGWSSLASTLRLHLVDLAVENSSWLCSSSWEANQSGFRDYDAVTNKISSVCKNLAKEHKSEINCSNVEVFYVCGSDHALKCALYDPRQRKGWCDGVVVMSRPSNSTSSVDETSELQKHEAANFKVVPTTTDDVSSTLIRKLVEAQDWEGLQPILHHNVLEYMKANNITFKKK